MTHSRTPQDFKLCETLKRLRAAHKLTQKQVAQKLGIATVTVSGWEIAKRIPEPHMLPKIAGVYGITVDNLLGHSTKADSVRVGDVVFVPVYESVAVREGRLAFLDYHGTYPVPTEAARVSRGAQAVLIPAPDASMALAGIGRGAQVLVHVNAKVRPGDLCLSILDSDRLLVRLCTRIDASVIGLQAADPNLPEELYSSKDRDRIHLVGPCVAVFHLLPRGAQTA